MNFKMLLLTRMGEALFRYVRLRGMEKFLHGPGNGARRRLLNGLGTVSVRQFGLRELGLVPAGQMEDIVRGAIGLATEGFFEGVAESRIDVRRDCTITRLGSRDGHPVAELSDGTTVPADLVVCATGFTQAVPFYVENFLDFPVGIDVPSGYYDFALGAWVPSANGRVIEVVGVPPVRAAIDQALAEHGAE